MYNTYLKYCKKFNVLPMNKADFLKAFDEQMEIRQYIYDEVDIEKTIKFVAVLQSIRAKKNEQVSK